MFSAALSERPPAVPSSSPITCAIRGGKKSASYKHWHSSGYHLGRADTVDNDHIIFNMEYETPAAVVAHHSAGLGMVMPNVGHRARPVQVGIHRKRHDFIAHIGHISVRSLSGHHRLQVIPQFRQIAKCRLPELNLVYCRNTHRPSYAKYQNTRPLPSARFRGSSQRLV